MNEFHGFSKSFFAFFRSLKANNERAWFEANKERFRTIVQAQMSEFIAAMAPELRKISKEFVADPRPNGGSMFRIHRDVRFARGFYVHLAPGEVFVGGGLWMPESEALARVRGAIAAKPGLWKKAVATK